MGTRELLLVLGAIILFSMTSLSVNRTIFYNKEAIWANEFEAAAIAIAQQYIEEAKTKAFDEVIYSTVPTGPSDFTRPSSLGPEAGETYPFDDFDDYNGFVTTVGTPRNSYTVSIQVGYVFDGAPDSLLSAQTYCKKITVTVANDLLPTVSISAHFVRGYF
ncbi:MAG: hypothetical protein ONB05_05515 [candidate division KSB1 bacterium]|nr:hypothetical protein [candidate division KSB1 bacterium]